MSAWSPRPSTMGASFSKAPRLTAKTRLRSDTCWMRQPEVSAMTVVSTGASSFSSPAARVTMIDRCGVVRAKGGVPVTTQLADELVQIQSGHCTND